MDKTDKVLKQFSRPEPMMVTPVGSDVIVPNLSGIKGNRDAMNKLTLQTITDNGATTTNGLTLTDGTNNYKIYLNSGLFTMYSLAGGATIFQINYHGFGHGGAGSANACLNLVSTSRGALLPRMSTTQKNAISTPGAGLIVYDTTLNKLCIYTGSAWETITSA